MNGKWNWNELERFISFDDGLLNPMRNKQQKYGIHFQIYCLENICIYNIVCFLKRKQIICIVKVEKDFRKFYIAQKITWLSDNKVSMTGPL